MKRRFALAMVLALTIFSVATAETGKPSGKQYNLAEQSSGAQVQSSQTKSYKGLSNSKPATSERQTALDRVPRFGFDSTFGWHNACLGEQVTRVEFGSVASRLGLQPGDAIVGVNGRDLHTAECWYNAIERAADQDGWVTLKIVDGRSGRMAYRTANLFQLNAR